MCDDSWNAAQIEANLRRARRQVREVEGRAALSRPPVCRQRAAALPAHAREGRRESLAEALSEPACFLRDRHGLAVPDAHRRELVRTQRDDPAEGVHDRARLALQGRDGRWFDPRITESRPRTRHRNYIAVSSAEPNRTGRRRLARASVTPKTQRGCASPCETLQPRASRISGRRGIRTYHENTERNPGFRFRRQQMRQQRGLFCWTDRTRAHCRFRPSSGGSGVVGLTLGDPCGRGRVVEGGNRER